MATVPSLPYTLQNGQVADATQVMADFNTIRNAVISNAAASGVNDDITQLLGLTTPLSPSQGGTPVFTGGTSTGSANAQVCTTLVPGGFALTTGNIVSFVAGFTNTGSVTFNGNGTGATAVKKVLSSGLTALTGGEIIVGGAYLLYYDGTAYQLFDPSTGAGGGGSVVNSTLDLKGNSTGAQTATWTVDQILAVTALGGAGFTGTSLTFNFNGGATGANGMDTGSMPTSGDMAIYAIYNPGTNTWACLGTITGHGPVYSGGNMPSGYTASALLWAGVTTGAAQFLGFLQIGNEIFIPQQTVMNNGTAGSWTLVSLASYVPVAGKTWGGRYGIGADGSGEGVLLLAADSSGIFNQAEISATTNAAGNFDGFPILTAQEFWYEMTTASGVTSTNISVNRYSI